jgi:transposase-like protein
MARHRSFSSEFERQLAKEFLDGRAGLHELARWHSLSRNLIRLWIPQVRGGLVHRRTADWQRLAIKNGAHTIRKSRSGNDPFYTHDNGRDSCPENTRMVRMVFANREPI